MARQGSDDSPIFVVGTPRSGTTLTARVLGNHSRIFMPAETHFFDDIYARRRELGDPADPVSMGRISARLSTLYRRQHEGQYQRQHRDLFENADRIARLMGPCADYRDVFSRFIGMQMEAAGKVRWGNQVPRDIFNTAEILAFYPDAKIIVCVRDLRDFLLSYSAMKNVVPPRHVARHSSLYHPVVTALLWRASVRRIAALRRQVNPDNLSIIRYEDLVKEPETVIRGVCDMIGEAFEPQMLEVRDNNSSLGPTRERASGIFGSSVGRWRSELPRQHACVGQKIAGGELRKLGYEEEPIAVSPIKFALIFLTFPFALLRGLHANRAKQPSLLPYVAKRLVALLQPSRIA